MLSRIQNKMYKRGTKKKQTKRKKGNEKMRTVTKIITKETTNDNPIEVCLAKDFPGFISNVNTLLILFPPKIVFIVSRNISAQFSIIIISHRWFFVPYSCAF